jgi:hypothetical protein
MTVDDGRSFPSLPSMSSKIRDSGTLAKPLDGSRVKLTVFHPLSVRPGCGSYCGGRGLSSPFAVNTAMQPRVLLPPRREPQIVLLEVLEVLAIGT